MQAQQKQRHLALDLLLLGGFLLGVGCSGEQQLGEEDPAAGQSFGLVAVKFAHELQAFDPTDLETLEVKTTAQFVRFAEMEHERVARLLALPLDPRHDLPDLDTCQIYDQSTVLNENETDGEDDGYVDLLEAGELHVETGSERLALEPRYFPGLLPFISGVVYGEAQASHLVQPGYVLARAAGSDTVGAFRASGMSPEPLALRTDESGNGQLLSPTAHELTLRWQSARAPLSTDATYLEVFDARRPGERVLRCAVADDGAFSIDRGLLDEVLQADSQELVLEAGRLRQFEFSARGLDSGELRLSTAGRTRIQLR